MLRSLLLITLVALSATAGAQGFGYNYLQASYGTVSFDDSIVDVDGSGFGISGSYAFNEDFYFAGEYQTADMDFGVDLNILELAVGYHTALSDKLDLTAKFGYLNAEIDAAGFGSSDDDGFLIGGGETCANVGFLFGLTDTMTVGAKASFWDDINVYQVNLRFDVQ